ncbi:pyridoxal phosphate-dependent aminotransferase [Salinicola halophyticus]|uniref:pyridoxal phosphate-dependent aminotransferase n=1 Tax=Salinicola halophyticus TaxID=1808881 RepID=UPI000DA24159|nr:aminotransferase class I/II-fold pyridoxal phosphate-dependent enzyme [Salinicola halophyticus]
MTARLGLATALLNHAYADDINATPASDTLLINEQSRWLESRGERVIKFGFGQSPFPVYGPAVEALAAHADHKAYLPVQGLPALRERVATFHSEMDGIAWNASRVLIGPGSKLLLFALIKALPAAEILIPAPAWVSYAPQARLAGQTPIKLAADFDTRWQITPEQLEAHCLEGGDSTRLLILNAPGNPTGLSPDAETQRALAEVARRHGVIVLADEIYGPLDHSGAHRAFARDYPEGTVTTSGLSKWCGAGGWRLGVMHAPEALGDEIFARLLGIASETWSSVTSPVQEAACVAYRVTPKLTEYLDRQRAWLSLIGHWCATQLQSADIRVHLPDGGFYLFPDFDAYRETLARRGITTSAELTARLLAETGVALLPGSAFGCDPAQLTARLAYVDFDGQALLPHPPQRHEQPMALPALERVRLGIRSIIDWLG